jgi:hypothetical protein
MLSSAKVVLSRLGCFARFSPADGTHSHDLVLEPTMNFSIPTHTTAKEM